MIKSPESKSAAEIFEELGSGIHGLTGEEAEKRLLKYGENVFAHKKRKSPVVRFLSQLKDPMIYILIAAAVISLLLHETADAVIILVVIAVDAFTGFVQENRAEKAVAALKKLTAPKAAVRRNGAVREIDAASLVPGDIVLLDAGRIVPADVRLVSSSNLKTDESALTGESEPADKDAGFTGKEGMPVGDRKNICHMSTSVSYGRGEGVVVYTGMDTEIGRIAGIIEDEGEQATPLQKQLGKLGKALGIGAAVLCAILFLLSIAQGRNVKEMMLTAVSLAVAAIPEGLAAVVTIVLAFGVQRMAKSKAVVRRLPTVETLGACTVICSDKTGTLTKNRMSVTLCYTGGKSIKPDRLSKEGCRLFLEGAVLCNDASVKNGEKIGDPTETALLDMGLMNGISREGLEKTYPRVNEIPFDSERKMMTTVHKCENGFISFTKGAPDVLLKHVESVMENEKPRPVTEKDISYINSAARKMETSALRVLGICCRVSSGEASENGLSFIGLAGMMDPPRPEAREAVRACREAGIKTVMITGDNKETAFAVAHSIGIAGGIDEAVSGQELSRMSQKQLNETADKISVFARVSPQDKVRIVKAYRAHGGVVAMTGDGVNDAPSLKSADIGIAMGITGTDVAKGAADMVLSDDNFATIRKAVEEGRGIYDNIRKSVMYLLTSNLGEILVMFAAILLYLPSPLTAAQILWVNLITDSFPALALGVDPPAEGTMKRPPRRPGENMLSRSAVLSLAAFGAIIGFCALAGFYIGHSMGGLQTGRAFSVSVLSMSQLFYAVCMRNEDKSVFRMKHLENKALLFSIGFGIMLQLVIVEPPLCNFFGAAMMDPAKFLLAVLVSTVPVFCHEIFLLAKHAVRRRKGSKK